MATQRQYTRGECSGNHPTYSHDMYVKLLTKLEEKCQTCSDIKLKYKGFGPSRAGSPYCESGSIASGGDKAHVDEAAEIIASELAEREQKVEELIQAARADAIEECAKAEEGDMSLHNNKLCREGICDKCNQAAAIRKLAEARR